jgi:hypothetical protein
MMLALFFSGKFTHFEKGGGGLHTECWKSVLLAVGIVVWLDLIRRSNMGQEKCFSRPCRAQGVLLEAGCLMAPALLAIVDSLAKAEQARNFVSHPSAWLAGAHRERTEAYTFCFSPHPLCTLRETGLMALFSLFMTMDESDIMLSKPASCVSCPSVRVGLGER